MENNELHAMLFGQLIFQNQQLALMGLGLEPNPMTGKKEKNLEYAKMAIDTLDMLSAKTKGNLSPQESAFLEETLRQLKFKYVECGN